MSIFNCSICNNAAMKRASRRLGHFYDEILAPVKLRATQYAVLEQIAKLDKPSMTDLSLALVLDRSALSHTLRPLERLGLLEAKPHPRDRRVKIIGLTESGTSVLETARPLWQSAQRSFETLFGVDESASLRQTLDLLASPEFRLKTTAGRHDVNSAARSLRGSDLDLALRLSSKRLARCSNPSV
jgi:DNA-binding MarR family transcriptional regulator